MEESKKKLVIGGVIGAIVIAVGAYFLWPSSETEAPVVKQAVQKPATDEAANYPVPAPKADAAPLPALGESDSLFSDAVAALFGNDAVQNFLVKTDIARHIVVTIDNLPRKKVAERLKPVKPIPGKFLVTGPEGAQTIAGENVGRYSTAVRVFDAVDAQALAASYFKMYPLLQQAYVDLGYPNGYFNNRLVEVIDHLLATPDVPGPIQVVQPNVMYEFADPRLEGLSSGQKTMIRLGSAHAATVKKKLRELRGIIAAKAPGSQPR